MKIVSNSKYASLQRHEEMFEEVMKNWEEAVDLNGKILDRIQTLKELNDEVIKENKKILSENKKLIKIIEETRLNND